MHQDERENPFQEQITTLEAALWKWNSAASDLQLAVMVCLESTPAVTDALAERLEANRELNAVYPVWEKAISFRDAYDSAERALLAALEPLVAECVFRGT